ncbi:MAG: FHA domain-containing protein, partial [Myxococcota bacterium]
MATIFKLIIEDDEGKTTVYPLADGDLTIGRKDGNTIRLMERNVSRRHARLERTNGAVYIQDLDSYNGVKINGERITGKYEVKEGDLVEIGDYHLALQKSVTRSEAPEPAMAGNSTWPQAGTVPDFALPNELLGDERSPRDTIIDQPVPASVPAKVIAKTVDERPKPLPTPAPDTQGRLPPFPSSSSALPEPSSAQDSSLPTLPPKSDLAPGPDVLSSMPRLICVSTTYAGKSYTLTRPELIIGRVEDNDIVIEHRSVSRNHAKILFDGRTHKII